MFLPCTHSYLGCVMGIFLACVRLWLCSSSPSNIFTKDSWYSLSRAPGHFQNWLLNSLRRKKKKQPRITCHNIKTYYPINVEFLAKHIRTLFSRVRKHTLTLHERSSKITLEWVRQMKTRWICGHETTYHSSVSTPIY